MDASTVLLIKLLTDVGMTAMATIAQVNGMTDEQKQEAIKAAELASNNLMDAIGMH